MEKIMNTCFVCGKKVNAENSQLNRVVSLPVCKDCKGTDKEKQAEKDYLESLAEGFVCGCI
jgi:hypothetical protein